MGCGHPSSWSGANRKAIRGLPRVGQLESAHHDKRMAKIARRPRASKFKLRHAPSIIGGVSFFGQTLLYRNCIDRRASYRGGFQRRPVPYRERRPAVFDRHQPAPSRNRWPWGALRFPQGLFGPAITVLKSKSVLTVEGQHALLVVDYQRRNQTTSLRRRRAKTRRPAHAAVTALPPKGGPQAG